VNNTRVGRRISSSFNLHQRVGQKEKERRSGEKGERGKEKRTFHREKERTQRSSSFQRERRERETPERQRDTSQFTSTLASHLSKETLSGMSSFI